jgi:hypothetical protein
VRTILSFSQTPRSGDEVGKILRAQYCLLALLGANRYGAYSQEKKDSVRGFFIQHPFLQNPNIDFRSNAHSVCKAGPTV